MKNEVIIEKLNNLIQTCKDGEEGYKLASESMDDQARKEQLMNLSAQRAGFVRELETRVKSFGGAPEDSGSFSATLHRGWMGFKGSLMVNEEQLVLTECVRGDSVALDVYKDALNYDLPEDLKALVEYQKREIKRVWSDLNRLIDKKSNSVEV